MPPKRKATAKKTTTSTKRRPHIVLVPIPTRGRGQQRGGSFLSDFGDTLNGTLRGASQMGMNMLPLMMMGRM